MTFCIQSCRKTLYSYFSCSLQARSTTSLANRSFNRVVF